jgi:hypothetical protein
MPELRAMAMPELRAMPELNEALDRSRKPCDLPRPVPPIPPPSALTLRE